MRRLQITLGVFLALGCNGLISANDHNSPAMGYERQRPDQQGQAPRHIRPEEVAEALDLTYSQQREFRNVMKEQREKIRAFMDQQHAETREQLSSVFTAEQLAKYDELMENKNTQRNRSDRQRPGSDSQKPEQKERMNQYRFAE